MNNTALHIAQLANRLTADKREIKDFRKFAKRTSFIRIPLCEIRLLGGTLR